MVDYSLDGFEQFVPTDCNVTVSAGGSGRKLADLKAWLAAHSPAPTQLTFPASQSNGPSYLPSTSRGQATIKGVTVTLSPEEVYQNGQAALQENSNNAFNFRNWYVEIDDVQVSPKWLVQQLTGVPVRDFDASAARRFLRGLGIPIYRKQ